MLAIHTNRLMELIGRVFKSLDMEQLGTPTKYSRYSTHPTPSSLTQKSTLLSFKVHTADNTFLEASFVQHHTQPG